MDGLYWLLTPQLQTPEQFWCDMTTDGGGWVLVARGREGWRSDYNGSGTPAEVRQPVTGPDAFTVRQLPARTVDALLAGTRVDALPDGVRLRRATNAAGTTWQESRFKFAARDRWVWTFGAEHRVGTWSFSNPSGPASTSGSGGQTNTFGSDNALRRVDTRETAAQGYTWGMAFGTQTAGSSADSSYLWSQSDGLTSARPFTQMYLRPKLRTSDLAYAPVPDGGAAATTLRPLAESGAEATTWGVTGLANGRSTELTTEVASFTQVGSRVYVGGNFRWVQRDGAGTDRVDQPYLAAFDVTTRQWVSSFRPALNGQVKALAALPDGRLVAGGDFTTVNGGAQPGLVALDPTTGATDASWDVNLENRVTGAPGPNVRSLAVQGGSLYLGGQFTHMSGGTRANPVYARNGARVSVADGTPDAAWNPNLNGTAVSVHVSPQGDRAYFAGYFTQVQGVAQDSGTAVSTAAGAPLVTPVWTPTFSSTKHYQQAVREVGGRVWLGGSEHYLSSWDRSSFARLSGNVTKNGGDFQVITDTAGTVYAGCHCNEWNYSDAHTWSGVGTAWTQADKIGLLGAWDAGTGRVVPDFSPTMKGRVGYGAWAAFADSTGRLWVGGDFEQAMRANRTTQWVGGFVTFAPRDSTAPSTPAPAAAVRSADGATTTLSWGASTDAAGVARYEVLRGDRVVGTTLPGTRSFEVPTGTDTTRWFVRAADAAGNRSATTPVLLVGPPPPDTSAPTAPAAVRALAVAPDAVELAWDAASDDQGVAGYTVLRDGAVVASGLTGLGLVDRGLTASTAYSYQVRATDTSGNVGPASAALVVTTSSPPPPPGYVDGWAAADGAPWSSAWTVSGSSGTADTTAGRGRLAHTDVAGAYVRAQLAAPAPATDEDLLLSYQWDSTSAVSYFNVYVRGSGGWANAYRPRNGYGVQLQSNSGTVALQRVADGTVTSLASVPGGQAVTTGKQWLRLKVTGSEIAFRTWPDGTTEPLVWTATRTDTGVAAPGQVFTSLVRGGSNVGVKSVLLDDLTLTQGDR